MSVRTFVRDGAPYGNYSMAYYSDWEDMCVTQAFDCGAHGACEMVEEPAGVYTPFCACRERWKGDQCEIEPPPAVTLAHELGAAGQVLKALLTAVPPKDDDGELFHGGGALS